MKWRPIDNMIASSCIQKLQMDINEGTRDATEFIPFVRDKKKAKELFNAWRVYFLDRMREEYEKLGWSNQPLINPEDILHDINYYNDLVKQEQEQKRKSA